jgi:hypothetical protein
MLSTDQCEIFKALTFRAGNLEGVNPHVVVYRSLVHSIFTLTYKTRSKVSLHYAISDKHPNSCTSRDLLHTALQFIQLSR